MSVENAHFGSIQNRYRYIGVSTSRIGNGTLKYFRTIYRCGASPSVRTQISIVSGHSVVLFSETSMNPFLRSQP